MMKIRARTTSIWTAVAERSGDTAFAGTQRREGSRGHGRSKAACPDSESGFPPQSKNTAGFSAAITPACDVVSLTHFPFSILHPLRLRRQPRLSVTKNDFVCSVCSAVKT